MDQDITMEEKIKEIKDRIELCRERANEARENAMNVPPESKRFSDLMLMFNFWDGQLVGLEAALSIINQK